MRHLALSEDAKFYQVIGEDLPIKILYFWEKDLSNLYANNPDIKVFSPEQKETFILLNNKLVSFNGNRSFTRKFSSKRKTAIKEYFRKNKIKVKLASDHEMERLIEFINSLSIIKGTSNLKVMNKLIILLFLLFSFRFAFCQIDTYTTSRQFDQCFVY